LTILKREPRLNINHHLVLNSESDEYGRIKMPDYYEIVHMELDFKETFVERERDRKLNELLPIFRII